MRNQRLLIRPLVLVALALAVLLAVAVGLVYFTLDAPGRAQFARLLAPRAALLVLAWALGVVAAMAALQRWWVPRVSALPELAEQTRALVNASAPLQLKARAQADQQPLADAVNALAAQRDALRADVAAEVARASASVRLERNRLAAHLTQRARRRDHHQRLDLVRQHLLVQPGCGTGGMGVLIQLMARRIAGAGIMPATGAVIAFIQRGRRQRRQFGLGFIPCVAIQLKFFAIDQRDDRSVRQQHACSPLYGRRGGCSVPVDRPTSTASF